MLELTKRFSPLDSYPYPASPQTSFGVRSSFLPHGRRPWGKKRMRDERTPKDVCGEANHSNPYSASCKFYEFWLS